MISRISAAGSKASKSSKAIILTSATRCLSTSMPTAEKVVTTSEISDQTTSREETRSEESEKPKKKKTIAELDEEMRLKMAGLAGDGGEAGIEYEDGQPVAMKRSVKNNMFRYI